MDSNKAKVNTFNLPLCNKNCFQHQGEGAWSSKQMDSKRVMTFAATFDTEHNFKKYFNTFYALYSILSLKWKKIFCRTTLKIIKQSKIEYQCFCFSTLRCFSQFQLQSVQRILLSKEFNQNRI